MTIPATAIRLEPIGCCHHQTDEPFTAKNDKMEKAYRIAEKVCAVTLGLLAAATSFWLFLPCFAFGALVGIGSAKNSNLQSHTVEGGSCSHGFIEQITGVKVPRSLTLISGFSVMAVHIDHHAEVFVPIVGLTLGIWVGHLASPAANLCLKRVKYFAFGA